MQTLHKFGFASSPISNHRDDGLTLHDAYITAALRCAPPANKPLREEQANCRPYLLAELDLLTQVRVVVALGRIAFDTYLVDEITAVGDSAFRERSDRLFKARLRKAGAVVCSHAMPQIRLLCDAGLVLDEGQAYYYEDLEEAIAHHEDNMLRAAAI